MYDKLTPFLAAALLTTGVFAASAASAESNVTPATPQQQPPGQMQGQGMIGRQGMPNRQHMLGMMSAMTQMANTCNTMMERASHTPASPGTSVPGSAHG